MKQIEVIDLLNESFSSPPKLRPYQEKIVADVGASNSLIVMPTGAGKTAIAAELIRRRVFHHKLGLGSPKIALFIVPSRALVEQQAKAIANWTNFSVATHQGGRKTPSKETFDILVGTAQAFLALQDRMESVRWANVCICVLDEVHHTHKNHVYRTMATRIQEDVARNHIQIVGLTASLTYETQLERIETAVLDLRRALGVQTVIYPSEEELKNGGYRPQARTIDRKDSKIVDARCVADQKMIQDSFFHRLESGRGSFVETQIYQVVKDMETVARCRFHQGFQSPLGERPFSRWEEYARSIRSQKMQQDDQEGQFFFDKLDKMYVALRLLADGNSCEDEELALAWIKTQKATTGIGAGCGESLKNKIDGLERLLQGKFFPRLSNLQKKLLEKISSQPGRQQGQAIVFVKKRTTALVVSDFLNQDLTMQNCGLTADYVTAAAQINGHRVSTEQSKECIQNFRDGKLRVLVATSVVEEGLDVPNVKVVVVFDHISTPVELCQRFGRAREEKPLIVVLIERKRRSIDDLQRTKHHQKHVIEGMTEHHAGLDRYTTRLPNVDYTAEKSREKRAFDKFLQDESKFKNSSTALLNQFKDKTKAKLSKAFAASGKDFQCTLMYTSVLRKGGFQASSVGKNKKEAERKCAVLILRQLRLALAKDCI